LLLNLEQIPETGTLHNRIKVAFEKSDENLYEQLMAIKWIGNSGSHNKGKVETDELLHAYFILHSLLDHFYLAASRKMIARKKADLINAKRNAKK